MRQMVGERDIVIPGETLIDLARLALRLTICTLPHLEVAGDGPGDVGAAMRTALGSESLDADECFALSATERRYGPHVLVVSRRGVEWMSAGLAAFLPDRGLGYRLGAARFYLLTERRFLDPGESPALICMETGRPMRGVICHDPTLAAPRIVAVFEPTVLEPLASRFVVITAVALERLIRVGAATARATSVGARVHHGHPQSGGAAAQFDEDEE